MHKKLKTYEMVCENLVVFFYKIKRGETLWQRS